MRADEAEELVASVLGGGGNDGGFVGQCIARAEGNPLFLEQLLHMAESTIGDAVRGSIQSLVQARMDGLRDSEREALQAAAVLGQQLSLGALRHVLGDGLFSCNELVAKYLLRPAGSNWKSAHALIRDDVYNALLHDEKRALHSRAAVWFKDGDAVLLTGHLERAEDSGAAAAYLAVARAETLKHRHDAAADLARRGAALPAAAIAYELLWLLGDMLRAAGDFEEAIQTFESAWEMAPDDSMRCRAWLGLVDCMRLADRYDDALASVDAVQKIAETNNMTAELSGIDFRRANICFPLGRVDDCLAEHKEAHRLGARIGRWGRGERSGETELRRLLALAQDAHLDMAVPALERALEQV